MLPYGSRVATSRINFRLLSRDALTHDKRLSIVSGDAATRALAASAGLPVFASVAEYESSLEGIEDAAERTAGRPPAAAVGRVAPVGARRGTALAADRVRPVPMAPSGSAIAGSGGRRRDGPARRRPPIAAARRHRSGPACRATSSAPVARRGASGAAAGARRGGRTRTPWLIGAAILALAVLVAGVGVYLLLPSATIAVTPRQEPVGPVDLTVDRRHHRDRAGPRRRSSCPPSRCPSRSRSTTRSTRPASGSR